MKAYLERIRNAREELLFIAIQRHNRVKDTYAAGGISDADLEESRKNVLNAEIELCEAEMRLKSFGLLTKE